MNQNKPNCYNCGAPHDGYKCNYCGTYYTNKPQMVKKIQLLNSGKISPKQAFNISNIKIFMLIIVLIVPFIYLKYLKRTKFL